MITQVRLQELLHYDPKTGDFTWRVARGKSRVGASAGSITSEGYLQIGIDGERFKAHRLAWLYAHGVWPQQEIDHIDMDGINNSLANLREASRSQNEANKPANSRNTSGVKGVCWNKQRLRWQAVIGFEGKAYHLGFFTNINDAAAAYSAKASELFGNFARAK